MANVNKIIRNAVKVSKKMSKSKEAVSKFNEELGSLRKLTKERQALLNSKYKESNLIKPELSKNAKNEIKNVKSSFRNKQIGKMNTRELKQLGKVQNKNLKKINNLVDKDNYKRELIERYGGDARKIKSADLNKQLNKAIKEEGSRIYDNMLYQGSKKDRKDFINKYKQSEKTKIAYSEGKAVDITKSEEFDETIKALTGEKNNKINKLTEEQYRKVYLRRMNQFKNNTLNLSNSKYREKQYREMFLGYGDLNRTQQKELWNEFEKWKNESREGEFDSWQTLSVISYNVEAAAQGKPTVEIEGVGKYGLQYKINAPASSDEAQESEERLDQIFKAHEEIQLRRLKQAKK